MTQEDWFDEFCQEVKESANRSGQDFSSMLFSMGIRYLKQSGLVAEKLRVGSKSDIIYERAKLVYCNP